MTMDNPTWRDGYYFPFCRTFSPLRNPVLTGYISLATPVDYPFWVRNPPDMRHVSHENIVTSAIPVNTLMPRQNGHHFADGNFKRIFLNENVRIATEISLKFVPKGRINSIPSLVQIMAWRRPGDKPLSEQMMVRLPTHICVARPQWKMLNTTYRAGSLEDVVIL